MSGPTISNADDVVDFLVAQHAAIKALFIETIDAKNADTQKEAFSRLRAMLAVHETAEEMLVHPRVRRKVKGGADVVHERLMGEHDAKTALRDLEHLQPGTAEFSTALTQLQAAVLAHAEREEADEFPGLRQAVDKDELHKLAKAVRMAERIAPTHPHPGVESAAANFAVGPIAAIVDRAHDALGAMRT